MCLPASHHFLIQCSRRAMGNCYSMQKDHETALKNFQRVVQLHYETNNIDRHNTFIICLQVCFKF